MRRKLQRFLAVSVLLLAAVSAAAREGQARPAPSSAESAPRAVFSTLYRQHGAQPGTSSQNAATPTAPNPEPEIQNADLTNAPVLTPSNAGRLEPLAQVSFGPWQLVTALAWSPDGRWLAAGVGERIELLEFPGLHRRSSFRTASLTHGLAFSPDSAWLAAASRDGYLRIWQTAALAGAAEAAPGLAVQAHRKGANAAAFSPLFSLAAGAQGWLAASGGNDAVAQFWDVSTGENTGMMVGGSFAVPSIAFLPDGTLLAVANNDRIRLREVGSERIAGTFASDSPLYSLAVSPDGQLLAAGASDNLVRVWPVDSAYRTGQEQYPEAHLFAGHNGRSGTFRALVWQVAFSPPGDLLASTGGDGALAVWAIDGPRLVSELPGEQPSGAPLALRPAHPGGAAGLAFHPQARLIATGGLDGMVILWGIKE